MSPVATLRQGRRHAHLSQRALAKRAGVSQSLVARIESGRVDPSVGMLNRLLAACGLRAYVSLSLDGEPGAAARRSVELSQEQRQRVTVQRRAQWWEYAVRREVWEELQGADLTQREKRAAAKQARLDERAAQRAWIADLLAAEGERVAVGTAEAESERDAAAEAALEQQSVESWRERFGPAGEALAVAVRHGELVVVGEAARAMWAPVATWAAAPGLWQGPVDVCPDPRTRLAVVQALARAGLLHRVRLRDGFAAAARGALRVNVRRDGELFPRQAWVLRPEQLGDPPSRPGWAEAAARIVLAREARDRRHRRYPPYRDELWLRE